MPSRARHGARKPPRALCGSARRGVERSRYSPDLALVERGAQPNAVARARKDWAIPIVES
eukprot:scaffold17267_cov123-Isochrysis_galbana.AAC.4